jgi:hypothetical protein
MSYGNMGGEFVSFSQVDKTLSEGGPLYVRNKAKHPGSGAASILVISYPTAEGTVGFNVPRVAIPFNICDHVDPESLRASRHFRKLVVNGTLEIVPEEQAERELRDPALREAFRRALKESDEHGIYQARADEIKKNQAAEAEIKAEKMAEQSAGMSHMLAAMDPRLAAALNTPQNIANVPPPDLGPNPRFRALETRVVGMAGESVVNELTLMYGDLTPNDLQAIATGSAWPAEAKKWARERIAYQLQALNEAAGDAGQLPPGEE